MYRVSWGPFLSELVAAENEQDAWSVFCGQHVEDPSLWPPFGEKPVIELLPDVIEEPVQ